MENDPTPDASGAIGSPTANIDALDIVKGGLYSDGKNLTAVITVINLNGLGGLPITPGAGYSPADASDYYILFQNMSDKSGTLLYMDASFTARDYVYGSTGVLNPDSSVPGWSFGIGYKVSTGFQNVTAEGITGSVDVSKNAISITVPLNAFQKPDPSDPAGQKTLPDPIAAGSVLTAMADTTLSWSAGVSTPTGVAGAPALPVSPWGLGIDAIGLTAENDTWDGLGDANFEGWYVKPGCQNKDN